MTPILYTAKETVFTHGGIGTLADTIKCEVTEERNGIYEAILDYPITGIHYESIAEDCIVKILPNEISNPQLFRIYKSSKPINGIVTIYLEHISYILNANPVTAYSVGNVDGVTAIQTALDSATLAHNFTAWSDIESGHSASIEEPTSVRGILGGKRGGILDNFGGEYEFDNFVVKLHAARGAATDVVIEYGKNLTDIKQESNISNAYTSLYPFAKYNKKEFIDGIETEVEHLTTLPEETIDTPNADNYGNRRALIYDFSDEFSNVEVTEAMLRDKATSYLTSNTIDTPSVNITVSFVQLWQTAEYADTAVLEQVKLCDTVTVRFEKLGVSASAKVIKTVYDSLLERYISIELGTAKSNFAQTVTDQQAQINIITGNIKTKTGELRQEFQIADAMLLSQIGFIEGDYVKESEFRQTVDEITASFTEKLSSGANLIDNSAGLNGVDASWEYTGVVQTLSDYTTLGNTASNSAIRMSESSTLSQRINGLIMGEDYIFTCKIKKSSVTNGKVYINDLVVLDTDAQIDDWTEYSVIINDVAEPSMELTLETVGDYLYITDCMLTIGSMAVAWSPGANEIFTEVVKINKSGISVSNSQSGTRTLINNKEFAVYSGADKVITVNQDETRLKKSIVDDDLSVGKLKFLPLENRSDGVDVILLD